MTYVATDLSGSSETMGKTTAAPRVARTRTVSDQPLTSQPMIATNPALTRVNGGGKTGSNNTALIAGVGVVALLALGGGTWALTHRAAPAPAPAPAAAPAALAPSAVAPTTAASAPSSNATAPIAAPPKGDSRAVTAASRNHEAPVAIRSLRTPASRTGSGATDATPAIPAAAPNGLSFRAAPQPQAVTPPVVSPAPEPTTAAPATSDATPAPAPTTINPAPQTVTPTTTAPAPDAPSAPQ